MPLVFSGTQEASATTRTFENSEVLPPGPVAVTVTRCPPGTACSGTKLKEALPCLLVSTFFCPRKVWPSPKPEGSADEPLMLKNWRVNFFPGVLWRLPPMVVESPKVKAEEISG